MVEGKLSQNQLQNHHLSGERVVAVLQPLQPFQDLKQV
jgi:hypothetical protein